MGKEGDKIEVVIFKIFVNVGGVHMSNASARGGGRMRIIPVQVA
jgi:hypothetical protein